MPKMMTKAIDLKIREQTGLPKLHGMYLVDNPVCLYSTEQAKLFLGLEFEVSADVSSLAVEFYPKAMKDWSDYVSKLF